MHTFAPKDSRGRYLARAPKGLDVAVVARVLEVDVVVAVVCCTPTPTQSRVVEVEVVVHHVRRACGRARYTSRVKL